MNILRLGLLGGLVFLSAVLFGQRGKNGVVTVNAANTIVNEFIDLTVNASTGNTSIKVSSSTLNSNLRFASNLAPGDLLFIYQTQGAWVLGDFTGGSPLVTLPNDSSIGQVLAYNGTGTYEFAEVLNVPNATTINLSCPLLNNYLADSGRTQVVRVPRYTSLTINAPGVLTAQAWNGIVGGLCVVEVSGNTLINTGASIDVSGRGFRGADTVTTPATSGNENFSGTSNVDWGAFKGEGIAGFETFYNVRIGEYGRGALANAGGGGCSWNAGGGGGANAGNASVLLWNGRGVPNPAYNAAWALEGAWVPLLPSTGGGRGGYSWANKPNNPLTVAPGNHAWGGDYRSIVGGFGGRPLDYSTGRVYMGGGGGAGQGDNGYEGGGGNGGGLIYIQCYGTVSGSGQLLANGLNGGNTTGNPSPTIYIGIDAAGGAGAGGTILINSTVAGTLQAFANGGNGGNQNVVKGALDFGAPTEAEGPGGGGGGGYIAISAGVLAQQVNGGANGTTNSPLVNKAGQLFPPNGATSGASGLMNQSLATYNIVTRDTALCGGASLNLSASFSGTPPAGAGLIWYDSLTGGTILGTGPAFTTPVLNTTTTYYVSSCPGFFRVPLQVTVSSPFSCSLTPTSAGCGSGGGITVSVSGGIPAFTYAWSSGSTAATLSNIAAGNYSLTMTDGGSCTATSATVVLSSSGLSMKSVSITSNTCFGQSSGSIGMNPSGGNPPYTYNWSNGSSSATVSGLMAGTYSVTLTDNSGCKTDTSLMVSSPAKIVLTPSTVLSSCSASNGQAAVSAAGGTGAFSYNWAPGGATSPTVLGLASGNYSVTVSDANSCTQSLSLFVGTTGGLSDSILIQPATCTSSNGSASVIVKGGSPLYTYSWSSGSTDSLAANLAAGTYSLTVTDAKGCSTLSTAVVKSVGAGAPVFITASDSAFCLGDSTTLSSSGFVSYNWLPSTGLSSVTGSPVVAKPTATVSYSLTATDASGCTSTSSLTITVFNPPAASAGSNQTIISGTQTTLNASGGLQYLWNGGSMKDSLVQNPTLEISQTTTFTVTVTDSNGCSSTASVTITVEPSCGDVFVPKAFSPNGDGQNDVLYVRGTCIVHMNFLVYNRWGENVFKSTDPNAGWNGLYNDAKSEEGVYVYYLNASLQTGKKISEKGNITLLR